MLVSDKILPGVGSGVTCLTVVYNIVLRILHAIIHSSTDAACAACVDGTVCVGRGVHFIACRGR